MNRKQLVDRLYEDFCDAEGGVSHPVFEAWCKHEELHGVIESGSTVDNLFYQTIAWVISCLDVEGLDPD